MVKIKLKHIINTMKKIVIRNFLTSWTSGICSSWKPLYRYNKNHVYGKDNKWQVH